MFCFFFSLGEMLVEEGSGGGRRCSFLSRSRGGSCRVVVSVLFRFSLVVLIREEFFLVY